MDGPIQRFLKNRPLLRAIDSGITGPRSGFKDATVTKIELPLPPATVVRANTTTYSSSSSSIGTVCGVAETAGRSEWYQVDFPESFLSRPSISLQPEVFKAGFEVGPMTGPSFGVPAWGAVNWANELGEVTYQAAYKLFWGDHGLNAAQKEFFTWTFPPGAKEIRGTLEKILKRVWDFMKDGFWLIGGDIGAKIDSVMNEHNPARFKDYDKNVQDANSQLAGLSERALNDSQRLLWRSIGLPEGVMMSPLSIRSVTASGFQFMGLAGQRLKVHWIATGPVTARKEEVEEEEERRRFRIFGQGPGINLRR